MAKAVKLADIAKELGVSTVTVSNALLGKKGVSEKMRKLIWKKAQEMGYVKSAIMAGPAQSDGHFHIGILISEKYLDNQSSFYWQIYQYLAALISKSGYFSMLEIISEENERIEEMPHILPEKQMDGIIVIGEMEKEYLKKVSRHNELPVVCLGFYIPDLNLDAVISDNYTGMYDLTNYMISKGNRNLAFVGEILNSGNHVNRYMGFYKALLEHRLDRNDSMMFLEDDMEISNIADRLATERPDGVVCVDDKTAEMLIAELRKVEISVPEEMSVAGFDNFCFDWTIHDHLTTYDAAAEEMAEEALDILLKRIQGQEGKESVRVVHGKLIQRDSVKEIEPSQGL
jgi:DNA-binding LacI/PurR family transcriptional regulator